MQAIEIEAMWEKRRMTVPDAIPNGAPMCAFSMWMSRAEQDEAQMRLIASGVCRVTAREVFRGSQGHHSRLTRPTGWIDHDKPKVGYEIPFNRHFYVFEQPRPLAEIDADLARVTDRIKARIEGLSA